MSKRTMRKATRDFDKSNGDLLRVVTVFSGIGAFEEALRQLNVKYEIVFACDNGERHLKRTSEEIDADTLGMSNEQKEAYMRKLYDATGKPNYVKQSYMANFFLDESRWHEDIRFLDGKSYKGKVDILMGGSPCQSFSTYGKKRGLEDARGTLFYDYARLIKEVQPRVFIYENVKGLLMHDKGRTWDIMKEIWESLGYNISYTVLNACDYGLPQSRRRLFLVGTWKSLNLKEFMFPLPIPLTCKSTDFLEKNIPDKYYLPVKGFKWVTEVERNQNKARINRDIIGCQTAVQQYNWSGDFRIERPKQHHYLNDNIYVGKYNGEDAVARKLMPSECLRLMGFPDFKIVVEDQIAYRQVGNSIAVPVLKALFKEIQKQILN